MLSEAFPVFVKVAVCAELLLPTVCDPNVSWLGLKLASPPSPVPEGSTVSGPPVPAIATAAVLDPAAVGRKVTLTAQLPPGARLGPQLLVWAKSELSLPVRLIQVRVDAALPSFTSITAWAALLLPTACGAKFTLDG